MRVCGDRQCHACLFHCLVLILLSVLFVSWFVSVCLFVTPSQDRGVAKYAFNNNLHDCKCLLRVLFHNGAARMVACGASENARAAVLQVCLLCIAGTG